MLHCKRPAVFLVLGVLLTSLSACANSPVAKNFEQSLAADPQIKDNPAFGTKQVSQPQASQTEAKVQLPADFPKDIPLYPNAQLQEITPATSSNPRGATRWLSSDPSNVIADFYSKQFQANNWQILNGSTADQQGNSFEARRNDLLLKISLQPKSVTNAAPNQPQTATELVIEYQPNQPNTTTAEASPTPNAQNTPENNDSVPQGDPQSTEQVSSSNTTQPNSTPESSNNPTATQEFNDLNKAPQELQKYIQDLTALNVLPLESKATKSNNAATNQFEPGKTITRREYARWLVTANNAMYANNSAKQIRLASESTQPAFSDVAKTDPDFPAIQGLAEAGLIPSPLSGDSTTVLFRPDAPLTREQLILWKIPLDTRQGLPAANLETVKQTWGFQDAGKIDPKALRAVLADHQNGEQSNIRRVFGYTTLFQPKKLVTRAEAAAVLWYFGTQGDGVSAADALKLKR